MVMTLITDNGRGEWNDEDEDDYADDEEWL